MTPRKHIFIDNSLAHVYFRCHDRNRFLEPNTIKKSLLFLLARYKFRYGIKIFEFCIMDNHVHLLLSAPNAENLGHFMRTVESQLARIINKYFKRDSQAIRERYKSPIVVGSRHVRQLTQYIYMNRFKVNRLKPELDYYCSAYWRLRKPHKKTLSPTSTEEVVNNLLAKLLDDYDSQKFEASVATKAYIQQLIYDAISNLDSFADESRFDHGHTLADEVTVKYRTEYISSHRRQTGPPNYFIE